LGGQRLSSLREQLDVRQELREGLVLKVNYFSHQMAIRLTENAPWKKPEKLNKKRQLPQNKMSATLSELLLLLSLSIFQTDDPPAPG
jgi:hypothetical protein